MASPVFRNEILGDINGDFEPRYDNEYFAATGKLRLVNRIAVEATPQNADTMNNMLNFDNPDTFTNCRKVTTFSVNKMLSEWRVTGSNKLVARREFDFATMTKVTELFAEDGVTVVQRRVAVTEYGDAIITSVYDGGQSDPVSVHNAAPVTHTNMLADGGTVDIADNKITTLEEHIVDGYAHQNIIIDGNQ